MKLNIFSLRHIEFSIGIKKYFFQFKFNGYQHAVIIAQFIAQSIIGFEQNL